MQKKISKKIIFSFSTLIVLLILSLLLFFNNLVRDTHLNILKREMREKIHLIELNLKSKDGIEKHKPNSALLKAVNEIAKIIELRVTLINFKGVVVADSDVKDVGEMDNHRYRIEIMEAMESGFGDSIRYSNTLNIDMLYYAKKSGDILIRLAKPLYEIEENLSKLRKTTISIGSIILVFSIVIIVIYTGKITGPIKETINFAEAFSMGDYSKRIHNYSNDEVGSLQRSLNRLADIIVEKIDNLILEQNKLNVTIETIQDGIAVIDHNRKIVIANKAFNEFLEIHILSKDKMYYEVIRNRSLNLKIDYCMSNGKPAYFEEKLLNGRIFDVYVNPIKEEKTIKGILVVLHDITERKKIDQLKTDLVGNISHELKTPIAILKGYLETIEGNLNDSDLVKEFINKAMANLDRQNSIVNDMLKLNLLETAPDFPEEDINLKEVIEGCLDLLHPKTGKKKIAVKTSLDSLNIIVKSSRFLVEEIFFNIIDNAINYNKEGGMIEINSSAGNGNISIAISDTGIGIPGESINRIFERFYRVDKSRSRSTGGTGLGLSIVKHAASMLGWEIDVSSGAEGTTFSIVI